MFLRVFIVIRLLLGFVYPCFCRFCFVYVGCCVCPCLFVVVLFACFVLFVCFVCVCLFLLVVCVFCCCVVSVRFVF